MIECSVCSKSMTDETGTDYLGMPLMTEAGTSTGNNGFGVGPEHSFSRQFLQNQLGRYQVGKVYNICWECLFKALKVKE